MVDAYIKDIRQLFDGRIICLLFYGSRARTSRTVTAKSDYDFCLVLDAAKSSDLAKLRRLSLKYELMDTTMFYLSELEKRGWHNFQFGNHGVFSLLYLAAADPIIGENVFHPQSSLIDAAAFEYSLRFQIMEYLWRLDNWILTLRSEEELIAKMQKYLIRVTHDMEVLQGDLSFGEINEYNNGYYLQNHIDDKVYFSAKTKKLFKRLYTDPKLSSLIALKESLKNDYLLLEQQWLSRNIQFAQLEQTEPSTGTPRVWVTTPQV